VYCEREHAECHRDRDFFRGGIRFQEQLHDLNYIHGTGEKHHPLMKLRWHISRSETSSEISAHRWT